MSVLGKRKEAPLEFLYNLPGLHSYNDRYHGSIAKSLPRDIWKYIAEFVEIADCGGITLEEYVKRDIEEEELLNVSPLVPIGMQLEQQMAVRKKVERKVAHIRERRTVVASL